jgi:hypothetical protein
VFSSIEVIVRLWIWAQLGETQRCCRRDIALRIQSDTREYARIRVGWRMKLIVAQWDSRKTPTTAVGWMPRRSATGMPKSPGCAGSRQAEPHADGAVAVGVLGTVLGFYRMGAGPSPDPDHRNRQHLLPARPRPKHPPSKLTRDGRVLTRGLVLEPQHRLSPVVGRHRRTPPRATSSTWIVASKACRGFLAGSIPQRPDVNMLRSITRFRVLV